MMIWLRNLHDHLHSKWSPTQNDIEAAILPVEGHE